MLRLTRGEFEMLIQCTLRSSLGQDEANTKISRRPEPFQGKRVVVIGMGSTATDTVVDLVGSASEVYMSHRSGGRIVGVFT